MIAELGTFSEKGALRVPLVESLSLDFAVEALRRSESGRTQGKLVLRVRDIQPKHSFSLKKYTWSRLF